MVRRVVLACVLVACLILTLVVTFRVLYAANGCVDCDEPHHALGFSVRVRVLDESGKTLPGAVVRLHGLNDDGVAPVRLEADSDGTVRTPQLRGPAVGVVEAPDHLPEPVQLGAADADGSVDVKLFARKVNRFAMRGDIAHARTEIHWAEGALAWLEGLES